MKANRFDESSDPGVKAARSVLGRDRLNKVEFALVEKYAGCRVISALLVHDEDQPVDGQGTQIQSGEALRNNSALRGQHGYGLAHDVGAIGGPIPKVNDRHAIRNAAVYDGNDGIGDDLR